MYIIYESEMYHHGVKGQRWGIRRYQKKDGTLTRKGRKHLQELENTRNNELARARNVKKAYDEDAKNFEDAAKRLRDSGPDGDEIKKMYGLYDDDADNIEIFGMTRKEIFDMELGEFEVDAKICRENANRYLAKEQALMKMDLKDFTMKKKDIIEAGRKAFLDAYKDED